MKKVLYVSALMLFTTACSMEASLEQLTKVAETFQSAKTTGLVSGSTQTGTATGNGTTYLVQSTVGNYMSGIEQTTTDNSYRVYSSVQGAIVSQ